MMYKIVSDHKEVMEASIDPYDCEYQPDTTFSLWLEEARGFHLKMKYREQEPKVVYDKHNTPFLKIAVWNFS